MSYLDAERPILRRITLATLLTCSLAAASCATSPAMDWNDTPKGSSEIQKALSLADLQIETLQSKRKEVADQSTNRANWTTAALLATAAAGISKVHPDVLKATAFTAGGIYFADNFASSHPRLNIYNAGITATLCARKAVTRIALPDGTDSLAADHLARLMTLKDAYALAQTAYAAGLRSPLGNSEKLLEEAKSEIAQGVEAAQTYAAAARAQRDAPAILKETLYDIRTKVDTLLEQTLADPKLVFSNLPMLYSAVGKATPATPSGAGAGAPAVPPPASGSDAPEMLSRVDRMLAARGSAVAPESRADEAFAQLRDATDKSFNARTKLLPNLPKSGLPPTISDQQLSECGVSPTINALHFIAPVDGTLNVTLPADGKTDPKDAFVHLAGGTKPYMWLKTVDTDKISLSQNNPLDASMTLKVKQGASKETNVLVIQDSSPTPQTVQLRLTID